MIRPRLLLERVGDPVSFDTLGDEVDEGPVDGPAVMVVARVTDALKSVADGLVSGPIDRERVARVVSFSVSRDLLGRLGEGPYDAASLIEGVRGLGADWVLVSQEDPLRPFSAQ